MAVSPIESTMIRVGLSQPPSPRPFLESSDLTDLRFYCATNMVTASEARDPQSGR